MKKTTQKQFNEFRAEVKKWLEFFGLEKQWNVHVALEKIPEEAVANCSTNHRGKIARIVLNTEYPQEDYDQASMRKVAFHEVCELLLAELTGMVGWRYNIDEADVQSATHRVIRNLESTIFERLDNGRE